MGLRIRKVMDQLSGIPLPVILVIVAVGAYLIGSINFSIIVSRIYAGDDVRKHGSGNAGMTNVLRTYGKTPAILTGLGDFAKGVVVVVLARLFFGKLNFYGFDIGYIAGFFVLLGHVFPVYFGFRGGKGVLTSLGVILVVDPVVFLPLVAVCLPLVLVTRIVSLGSISGAVLFPVFTFLWRRIQGVNPWYDAFCALVIGATILILHRENIKRLINGTENRFGGNKKG